MSKGNAWRTNELKNKQLYCEHDRFRDKCDKCKQKKVKNNVALPFPVVKNANRRKEL